MVINADGTLAALQYIAEQNVLGWTWCITGNDIVDLSNMTPHQSKFKDIVVNDEIAYVCTTGKEFLRKGTSKPLMVKFISGKMPFEKILQDVFSLSTLTFTKLDDCSRIPFTIKILDIMLRNFASDYDKEKYDFSEFEDFEMPKILKEEINLN